MTTTDAIAITLSGLSLFVAIIGTILSNRRSSEALEESRKSTAAALWFGVQEAVQRFIGFDPNAEPIGDRLANLRISMIALVDELEDWKGLGEWLEAERVLGATLGRQAIEDSKPGDSVEQRVNNIAPLMAWAHALSQNLRRFRSNGHDVEVAAELTSRARGQVRSIHESHGWMLPTAFPSGLEPLG